MRLTLAAALVALGGAVLLPGGHPASAATSFTTPVALPGSAGFGEPSIAVDSADRLFATAPQTLGNITGGGSPVWTSTNLGASWGKPVAPTGDPLSGGDTDLAVGPRDAVYQTDLWLGNAAMALSTNHGASFLANEFGEVQPGDDRPWLAYSAPTNTLFMAYDGADAIHVAHSLPLVSPDLGLALPVDVPAVPESLLSVSCSLCGVAPVRECLCPPGGIAVDQSSGEVYVSYSRQNGSGAGGGVGIARSTNNGLTWSNSSVPGAGSSGSAFDTEWNFAPIKVDSQGNVYVAWGESQHVATDANGNQIASGGVLIRYSWSSDHGKTWHAPVTLSTTTADNVFPTLDVVSPGVVDVAWYGANATGDPNQVPSGTQWSLMFTQVTGATTAPAFTPQVAQSNIHQGCIQSGGLASCADRSLLDFFQLVVDHTGMADIIYTAGNQGSGATPATTLLFTRQATATVGAATPATAAMRASAREAAAAQAALAARARGAAWRAFRSF
jgi:hypothetical protein